MPVDLQALTTHYAPGPDAPPPSHLGRRYDKAGVFQREPGNTVVCHLVLGSQTEQALIDARARYQAMPEAGKLAFTPVESYHMTLFQGIIEHRRVSPYWPSDVASDTSIEGMTALFLKRLDGFKPAEQFKVAVTAALPTGLIVEGASVADRHIMADWRNRLAELFGYSHPDHDSYVFHITMAYMIEWLDAETIAGWQAMLDSVAEDIVARAPVLELRAPAFCSFNDMNWFEELQVLDGR